MLIGSIAYDTENFLTYCKNEFEMLNFNYSTALLMECGAFVKLPLTTTRWDDYDDDMERQ